MNLTFRHAALVAVVFGVSLNYLILRFKAPHVEEEIIIFDENDHERSPLQISTNATLVCDSTQQYCNTPLEGVWVRTPKKTFHNPICCPWDKSDRNDELLFDLCGTENWPQSATDLEQNAAQHYTGNTSFLAQSGGHGCICHDRRNFTDDYTWMSPSLVQPFNATYTCELLGKRRVLIVGDSTGQQLASTLMNSLFHTSCVAQFRFVQSDFLLPRKKERGYNITTILDRYQDATEIVLWGVGPHVYGNFPETLQTVVPLLLERYPHLQFIYKTQQPGGCSDEPLLDMSPDEAAQEMIKRNLTWNYNYREFYDRDMFAMQYLRERSMPIFDLRMLYNRPDAHTNPFEDCLHMCIPGPLDVVADLFQQLLIDHKV
ncbi:hypothetical protein FisN_24Lh081 [Fistulifera solaris]|uniref:Uncharacterized protein n=1 Tax=Fistulifera solaris TaxID=1519565 RepID=A0A1Z5K943_FISSO|nr:hypothetical protein FisN_24Lh081 [Fistulifera solaris]|eukprot:GAX22800.1 hypothetical protein FisN_24Lh081 [Fistulifera solaris]